MLVTPRPQASIGERDGLCRCIRLCKEIVWCLHIAQGACALAVRAPAAACNGVHRMALNLCVRQPTICSSSTTMQLSKPIKSSSRRRVTSWFAFSMVHTTTPVVSGSMSPKALRLPYRPLTSLHRASYACKPCCGWSQSSQEIAEHLHAAETRTSTTQDS